MPEASLRTADLLGLEPHQCLMVAAHNDDLRAARTLGFRAAFVPRPRDGPKQITDLRAEHAFDVVASDFLDLADRGARRLPWGGGTRRRLAWGMFRQRTMAD